MKTQTKMKGRVIQITGRGAARQREPQAAGCVFAISFLVDSQRPGQIRGELDLENGMGTDGGEREHPEAFSLRSGKEKGQTSARLDVVRAHTSGAGMED